MKTFYNSKTRYYKYVNTPFIQPTLNANRTVGGNSFACYYSSTYSPGSTNHEGYHAFDKNLATYWHSAGGMPQWLGFYNPDPIKVTKLTITNPNANNQNVTAGKVYASNDNNDWTDLGDWTCPNNQAYAKWDINLSSNTNAYKYYRIYVTACNYYHSGYHAYYAVITEVEITATQTSLVESTSSDYDIEVEGNAFYTMGGKMYLY